MFASSRGLTMLAVDCREGFADPASSGTALFFHRPTDHSFSSSGVGCAPYGFPQPPEALHNPPPAVGGGAATGGVLVGAGGSPTSSLMRSWAEDVGNDLAAGSSIERRHPAVTPSTLEEYHRRRRRRCGHHDDDDNTLIDSHHLTVGGITTMKMKAKARRKKVREPRFCFKTMSDVDVLDDGYKWRKYGQKVVKNTQLLRSYYRCTTEDCRVKKRVERLAEDPRMVITTYEGRHAHSPPHAHADAGDHSAAPPPSSHFSLFFC